MDEPQIRSCLNRCKVLWTAAPIPSVNPKPISREHFHKLLEQAGTGPWRTWLPLGLNLCMSIGEVCGLRWEWFDLTKDTFSCIREKTKRKRIPRAATLWPETLRCLKGIPQRGAYVLVSSHGTQYNESTRGNEFSRFRGKLGLPVSVSFGCLRDGAYTAALRGCPDERWARVLVGHTAGGLQDNYVLRDPEMVKPACDANGTSISYNNNWHKELHLSNPTAENMVVLAHGGSTPIITGFFKMPPDSAFGLPRSKLCLTHCVP